MPDMIVKLYDLPETQPIIERPRTKGIVVRAAMACEKHLVVEWVRERFGDRWASECDVAFRTLPVSCKIAVESGEIVGFACYESTCKNFFGPVGVAERKRGLGIGKALLLSSLHAMAAEGYAYAIVGAAGPVDFFSKTVGAVVIEGSSPGIYRDLLAD